MNVKKYPFLLTLLLGIELLLAACTAPAVEKPFVGTQSPAMTQTLLVTLSPAEVTAALVETEEGVPEIGSSIPQGWKIYSNSTYNYAFAYPAEWEVCNEAEGNIQLCEPLKEPGVGPLPSFYVAVIPKNAEGSPFDAFTPEAVHGYLSLGVGESELTEPDAQPAEYFRYTRLADAQGWDFRALVIENDHVWEAPTEVKDRRALVITDAGIFILGSYYDSPEALETYKRIMETFELKR